MSAKEPTEDRPGTEAAPSEPMSDIPEAPPMEENVPDAPSLDAPDAPPLDAPPIEIEISPKQKLKNMLDEKVKRRNTERIETSTFQFLFETYPGTVV